MAGSDGPQEQLWLVTADNQLFEAVRQWALGDLRDVGVTTSSRGDRAVLIATPSPWRSVVAIARQHGHQLYPVLALKNAVSLWSMRHPPDDGPLPAASWPELRRRFLIHNPGLDGVLRVLDDSFEPEEQRRRDQYAALDALSVDIDESTDVDTMLDDLKAARKEVAARRRAP